MAGHRTGRREESHSSNSLSSSSSSSSFLPLPHFPSCPFCGIASAHPPIRPSSAAAAAAAAARPLQQEANAAYLILSTKHVLAFLDIMPLTKGHALLVTRGHWEKLGEVGVEVGKELGKWLPVISRVVTRTILGKDQEVHWNVVQNNGTRAAQVVPHIHFHIIPRPADNATTSNSAAAAARSASWTMFGRGQREELDEEEGEKLARLMREELAREVKRIKDEEGIDLDLDDDNNNDNNGDYHYHNDDRDINGTMMTTTTTKGRGLGKL